MGKVAAVMWAIVLPTLVAQCTSTDQSSRSRNVILVSIDCLRADRVNAYGYEERETTPQLDRLARDGVSFKNAFANAPWTIPSHMSIFTSLYPSAHGLNIEADLFAKTPPQLSASIKTLAGILRENGFKTAAFTAGGGVSAKYGFGRGFELYDETDRVAGNDLDQVYEKARSWISANRRDCFFLFFHTYEVHQPHTHDSFAEKPLTAQQAASIGYDRDLKYTDSVLGHFFGYLKELGLYKQSIIVVLSDHGEALLDRFVGGRADGHGYHLHDELLKVPLIFVAPGLIARQERPIRTQVELVDVMPTLLDLLQIAYDRLIIQGRSLMPLLKGGTLPENPIFAEAPYQGPLWGAVRTRRFKFIWSLSVRSDGVHEVWWDCIQLDEKSLFGLLEDPEERRNIASQRPIETARMEQLLHRMRRSSTQIRQLLGNPERQSFDAELLERLRSLGYIQ
ncbi:sulfatase-like hydrolase/transferase [Acidobacteria bacterium AH-259-G07]|nr:sulfatase-like hydrolase/transferase [Acidobacteria bacterium AH-259-G07]